MATLSALLPTLQSAAGHARTRASGALMRLRLDQHRSLHCAATLSRRARGGLSARSVSAARLAASASATRCLSHPLSSSISSRFFSSAVSDVANVSTYSFRRGFDSSSGLLDIAFNMTVSPEGAKRAFIAIRTRGDLGQQLLQAIKLTVEENLKSVLPGPLASILDRLRPDSSTNATGKSDDNTTKRSSGLSLPSLSLPSLPSLLPEAVKRQLPSLPLPSLAALQSTVSESASAAAKFGLSIASEVFKPPRGEVSQLKQQTAPGYEVRHKHVVYIPETGWLHVIVQQPTGAHHAAGVGAIGTAAATTSATNTIAQQPPLVDPADSVAGFASVVSAAAVDPTPNIDPLAAVPPVAPTAVVPPIEVTPPVVAVPPTVAAVASASHPPSASSSSSSSDSRRSSRIYEFCLEFDATRLKNGEQLLNPLAPVDTKVVVAVRLMVDAIVRLPMAGRIAEAITRLILDQLIATLGKPLSAGSTPSPTIGAKSPLPATEPAPFVPAAPTSPAPFPTPASSPPPPLGSSVFGSPVAPAPTTTQAASSSSGV